MTELNLDDRLKFLAIDDARRQALAAAKPSVMAALPDALADLYDLIDRTPAVADMFTSERQKDSARKAQGGHWERVMSGAFDGDYAASIQRIASAHSRLGLEPRYFIGSYAHVLSTVLRAVVRDAAGSSRFGRPRLDEAEARIDAVVRALMLDIELAVTVYLDETEAAATRKRASLAEQLEDAVGTAIASLGEASGTLDQASSGLEKGVEHTVGGAASAAAGAEEAAANVKSVAAAAAQLGAASKEIAGQATAQSGTVKTAVDHAASAGRTISELGDASGEISSVIRLIEDIAEQTNLLALNATIEAARAGESGKGFAVVAAEVKQLAEQTAAATDRITGQVEAIQTASGAAVKAVEAISSTIESINEAALAIEAAVEEQTVSVDEIARNAEEAASGNQSAAEAAATLERQARETGEAASSVSEVSGSIRTHAEALRAAVSEAAAAIRAA